MKKIIPIFRCMLGIWLLFCMSIALAESRILLNLDKQEIDIQDLVELRIDIELEDQADSVQIEIPGIDDFIVLGESQSQSIRTINGVSSQNFVLVLSLQGRESGSFEIGPIQIGDVVSNIQTLKISGEAQYVGGQIDTDANNNVQAAEEENSKQLAEQYLQAEEDARNVKILEEHSTKDAPQEFRDIKKLSHISPINLKNSFFLILLFLFLFIIYKLYLHIFAALEKKQEEQIQQIKEEPIIKQTDFHGVLQSIEKNDLDIDKELFYGKLGSLMRDYFDEKIEKGLSSKTFGELRKRIKQYPSLTRIYEKIYFPEYNLEKDTKEQRIEIINILKDELI